MLRNLKEYIKETLSALFARLPIRFKKGNKVFVVGVGGYNGVNEASATTLQNKIRSVFYKGYVQPHRVVAARRIPKVNWGGNITRFSKRPTFVFREDEAVYVRSYDSNNNVYAIYAPVLHDLLQCGILNTDDAIVNEKVRILNARADDYIEFVANKNFITGEGTIHNLLLQFNTFRSGQDRANAVRKTDEGYHAQEITSSLTTSPNIEIQDGIIIAKGNMAVFLGQQNFTVTFSHNCFIKIRRTGRRWRLNKNHKKVTNFMRWRWLRKGTKTEEGRNSKRIFFEASLYQYTTTDISGCFSRKNREIVHIRAYRVAKRGRYYSRQYTEFKAVRHRNGTGQ